MQEGLKAEPRKEMYYLVVRHGGLPAKGKEVFFYRSGLVIEWTQMINSGFVVTGPLRTLRLLYCTIFSGSQTCLLTITRTKDVVFLSF